MSKITSYRTILRSLSDWDDFLLVNCGLPGPRGNLELAAAVAEEGDETLFNRYLDYDPRQAPANNPLEFLAFCGVLGIGSLLALGRMDRLEELRLYASDPRWRIREAVAMALQRLGDGDMDALISTIRPWSRGSPFAQRAVAAALCEPRLLREERHSRIVLQILDDITASIQENDDRKSEGFHALKKGLGYCWSVAVAACPEAGKPFMEKWLSSPDKDIRWIMKENLKKDRLKRMDEAWVIRHSGT